MKRAEYEMSKIMTVVFSVLVAYLIVWFTLQQILLPRYGMAGMMAYAGYSSFLLNFLSLLIALSAGLAVYLFLSRKEESSERKQMNIIKRLLSDDEQRVLEEVERAGEITQDSLRFRLNWSKAKLSAILTNLDKSDLIQRKREGKTYRVCLSRCSQEKE